MADTNVSLLGQQQDTGDSPVIEAVTAFLVYQTESGVVAFTTNINLPVTTEREANGNDMLTMVTAVRDEIIMTNTAMLAAQNTMAAQMHQIQQLQEAQRNQQLLAGLGQGGLVR